MYEKVGEFHVSWNISTVKVCNFCVTAFFHEPKWSLSKVNLSNLSYRKSGSNAKSWFKGDKKKFLRPLRIPVKNYRRWYPCSFISESADDFFISSNTWTFYFPETKISGCNNQPRAAVFLALQTSKQSNMNTSSISKQFLITEIQSSGK